MDDGREVKRYENTGSTPEERRAITLKNLNQFEIDAQAGKPCCISDLIGQAEQCVVDRIEERRGAVDHVPPHNEEKLQRAKARGYATEAKR